MKGISIFWVVYTFAVAVVAGYLAYSIWSPDEEPDQTETTIHQVGEAARELDEAIGNDEMEKAKTLLVKVKNLRQNLPENLKGFAETIKTYEKAAQRLIESRERQNNSP